MCEIAKHVDKSKISKDANDGGDTGGIWHLIWEEHIIYPASQINIKMHTIKYDHTH